MAKKKKPNYYEILGLTVKANDKQIKSAAIKKAHQYSPDRYKGGDADAKAEMILEARDTLLDFDKRKKYDQYWLENYANSQSANAQLEQIKERNKSDISASAKAGGEALLVKGAKLKTNREPNKFFKFFDKCQLPEREVNKRYPFLFKIYNWKTDGIIFILTAIIIPLISVLLLGLVANMGHDNPKIAMNGQDAAPMVFFGINIVSNIVGFIIFWQRDSRVFVKSGTIIFYSYIFIVGIVSIIASLILGSAIQKPDGAPDTWTLADSHTYNILVIWFQVLAEIIVIYLALAQTKDLKKRMLMTLKENWKMWLIVVVISGVLLFVFIQWVMPGIFHDVPKMTQSSSNEDTLENGLKAGSAGYRAGYAISLFVFSVLVAPMTEELATRHAVYTGVSNRTLAFFMAALYFGMLHVEGGDVEHIVTYIVGGLFLSGVFSISRGNVTYDIGTHMLYNCISFIVICAKDMHS